MFTLLYPTKDPSISVRKGWAVYLNGGVEREDET
jgi:hypothetical protein